jgi:hypothetical protein
MGFAGWSRPSRPALVPWGRWTASAFIEWSWPGGRCYMGQRCWHEACCWLDWWKMDSKTMGLTSRSKVFVQFFHSFWEESRCGCDGRLASTITDLSGHRGSPCPGVLELTEDKNQTVPTCKQYHWENAHSVCPLMQPDSPITDRR